LLARLATHFGKPNGQFLILPNEFEKLLLHRNTEFSSFPIESKDKNKFLKYFIENFEIEKAFVDFFLENNVNNNTSSSLDNSVFSEYDFRKKTAVVDIIDSMKVDVLFLFFKFYYYYRHFLV
jgi:hypothetical protein